MRSCLPGSKNAVSLTSNSRLATLPSSSTSRASGILSTCLRTSIDSTSIAGSMVWPPALMVATGIPISALPPIEGREDQRLARHQLAEVVERDDLGDPQVVLGRAVDLAAQQRQRVACADDPSVREIGRGQSQLSLGRVGIEGLDKLRAQLGAQRRAVAIEQRVLDVDRLEPALEAPGP